MRRCIRRMDGVTYVLDEVEALLAKGAILQALKFYDDNLEDIRETLPLLKADLRLDKRAVRRVNKKIGSLLNISVNVRIRTFRITADIGCTGGDLQKIYDRVDDAMSEEHEEHEE